MTRTRTPWLVWPLTAAICAVLLIASNLDLRMYALTSAPLLLLGIGIGVVATFFPGRR